MGAQIYSVTDKKNKKPRIPSDQERMNPVLKHKGNQDSMCVLAVKKGEGKREKRIASRQIVPSSVFLRNERNR